MKNQMLTLIFGAAIIATSPVLAMDTESFKDNKQITRKFDPIDNTLFRDSTKEYTLPFSQVLEFMKQVFMTGIPEASYNKRKAYFSIGRDIYSLTYHCTFGFAYKKHADEGKLEGLDQNNPITFSVLQRDRTNLSRMEN